MVVGHSMSTIYSATKDITTFHGKVVLFTGDCKGNCECIPVILPPQSAFGWNKCSVIENYANHTLEYGKLWELTANDGTRVEIHVPRMITLPLWVARLYHQFKGVAMPHKLLNAMEQHLASPATSLDNGDNWGLVQKWLLVAAQKDSSGGDLAKSKSLIAFHTDALLSNDDFIHRWITEKLDAMLGRHPKNATTKVGI